MSYSTSEFKPGLKVLVDNDPCTIIENEFVKQASLEGLANLKGHRSVGGCRASIYNAMPRDGVETLVAFMDIFQANNPI